MKTELIRGDITKVTVDVIVNAANTSLLGGGGVDGAIHRAGGGEILEACRAIRARQGGCKVGEAVITTAGKLDANYVIHTVGPRFNDFKSDEKAKLASCYRASMQLALSHEQRSIAFPCISTGIYRFPPRLAAEIAIGTVSEFSDEDVAVLFVCFDADSYKIYRELLGAE